MSNFCFSCKQLLVNQTLKRVCPSCQKTFCSNCLYQRIALPKLNYQMHDVCTGCYHQITSEMLLSKPPKGFMQRLEQTPQPLVQPRRADPETQALEERLQKLRMEFPSPSASSALPAAKPSTAEDLLQQMNDELLISKNEDDALEARLRLLHETMPVATSVTAVAKEMEKKEDDEEEEFPWCTVCNENATKRCLDCEELFCETCAKKIHRQSNYKKHQIEVYKPSAKAKKKYGY